MNRYLLEIIARQAIRELPMGINRLYRSGELIIKVCDLDAKGDILLKWRTGLSLRQCKEYDTFGLYHRDKLTGKHIVELNYKPFRLGDIKVAIKSLYHEIAHAFLTDKGIKHTDNTAEQIANSWLMRAGYGALEL